jgi:NADPH:quinone reductase
VSPQILEPTDLRIVAFSEYGRPEVLHVITKDIPRANQAEVVVRIAGSTINPTDIMMSNGRQADLMANLSSPFLTRLALVSQDSTWGSQ